MPTWPSEPCSLADYSASNPHALHDLFNPPHALKRLTFIIQIYAPQWFGFRKQSHGTDAPHFIFKAMKLLSVLPEEEQEVVLPVFERRFYWAHPENLLLVMLADLDKEI